MTTSDEEPRYKPSLTDVRFDSTGFRYDGESQKGKKRLWHVHETDELGLYLIELPPDLPRTNTVFKNYKHYFQGFLEGSNGTMIDCAIVTINGCQSIVSSYSVPLGALRKTFVGSIHVPFEEFSFVFKCQCEGAENGGLKEAILANRGIKPEDYLDVQFDQEFPDHPIARVRRILNRLTSSIIITQEAKSLPRFNLRLEST